MKKIGIFYGSSTGTTESVAHTIAQKLGVASNDVHDASKLTGEMVKEYDVLVLVHRLGAAESCKTIGTTL